MALVVKDRVQETTTTTGTGTITLGGAVLGFQSFATIGDGNATYYTINDTITGDWEVGIGTYTASGTTLSRTTVLSSSNAGSLVPFTAGSKNVFVTYPSSRSVYKDLADVYTVQQAFDALTANSIALTTGTITTAPVNNTDIVNKQYADAIASGIHFHEAVDLATTTALPANTYNNGASGVGATLTATANGALSVDSTLTVAANRILVKNEAAQANNGVYTVTQVGSAGTPYILTRATDFDTAGTGVDQIDEGDFFLVTSGTVNLNTAWVQQTAPPITIGTTAIVFQQFAAPITYTAGTGLSESPAYTFNIATTGVTAATYGSASQVPVFAVNAQGQITSVTNTAIAIAAGAVSGLAASATTDTTNAANITSGTLPTGRLSGSYTGITGVGTLTAGTWNGSVIGPVYGGTGFGTYAVGDLLYADTTTSLAKLADVAVGNALISGGVGSAPSWGKIGLATHVSGTLPIASGGTNTSATATNGGVTYGTGTAYAFTAAGTSGQVLQSNGAAAPTWVNLSTLGVSSFSAGTTGFTPSTATSGAVTLAGTLNVANGGTGVTTSTGSGANVLSTSPSLVTPILGTPQSGNFSTGTFTWPTFNQNTTGTAVNLSTTRSNWSTNGTITAVVGQLAWKNYGNSHTIFDASASTSPDGTAVGNTNASVAWSATYPTLMGWNGASTYGVRVDSARVSDSAGAVDYNNLTNKTGGTGTYTTSGDYRAPIFYDSNNTAYYVDPASASNIGSWTSTSVTNVQTGTGASVYQQITNTDAAGTYAYLQLTASGAGDGYLIKNRTTGNSMTNQSLYLYNSSGPIEFVPNANQALRTTISTGGSMTVATDIRAPIFYDSNNTGYYLDPNSRSNLYTATFADSNEFAIHLTAGSIATSNKVGIGFNTTDNNYGIYKPAGAWTQPLYIYFYTGIRHYTEQTYDYGTSFWNITNGMMMMSIGQGDSNVRVFGDIRSPIYYDYNNTGYYGDFASTSNFNRLNLIGWDSSGRNYSREWIELPNYTGIYSPNNAAHFYPNNQSSYTPWIVQGSRSTWRGLHFYDGGNQPHLMFDGSANGGIYYEAGGRWGSYYSYSNNCWGFGTSSTSSAYNIYCPTGVYSGGRVDGTIFYDSNDTAYYLDPNSTSTSLNVAGRLIVNGNMVVGKGNNAVSTNTAIGVSALASVNSNYHTAVGYSALSSMTTYTNPVFAIAGGSTAVGYGALQSNVGNATLGAGNTAIGSGAMYTSTGAYLCTTVGAYSGYNLTNANGVTIVGHRAGQYMQNNSNCVIIGYNAAPNLNSAYGAGNTTVIIGNNAGAYYFGSNNTIIGNNAGNNMAFSDSSASTNSNVVVGANVLSTQSYDTLQCTFVGYAAMNTWDGQIINSSSLGYLTNVTGNNQVQLGNSSTTTYVYGTVQNRSDARDKADIRDTQLGLGFIEALRPVDFRWDYRDSYVDLIESEDEEGNDTSTRVEHPKDGSRKRSRYHHGLIAQEVKEVLDAKGIDFGGYQDHSVAGGKDVLTIGYDELVGPLIKAVQELSTQVKALSLELADLKAKS